MSDARAIALERMQHMLEAADAIASYVARGREVFDGDAAVRKVRDRITHQYWAVDADIVWETAVEALPVLRGGGALARLA
jgi:uncharacterized protein with HEPN domain